MASTTARGANTMLWIIQSVLAALFLYAGGFKLVTPLATLAKLSPFPAQFLRFIGICEVAGALGLILPGLLGIKRGLTPLAATGLVGIMVGAVTATIVTLGVLPAIFPLVVGLLAAAVAWRRWSWAVEMAPARSTYR
ncbi:MAG TPA: DoxX family protein [Gemmatimonadales bacterium]|nr:DoxX family protein [Gemmatimonadales bacterium]